MANPKIDMTGMKYNRLTVIEEVKAPDGSGKNTWKCRCDCGNEIVVVGGDRIRKGHTKSCGCLLADFARSRTSVGHNDIKISKDILRDIRAFISQHSAMKQKEQVDALLQLFPQFAHKTMPAYINSCKVSDRVFQLYLDDKISLGALRLLGTCEPISLSDFLADEMIERKMTTGQLEEARSLMRNGRARSWDEAFKEAMGQVVHEIKPPTPKRNKYQIEAAKSATSTGEVPQSFDQLLEDILISGTNWRMKVQMAIDMATFVPEAGAHHFTVFNKVYMLRHILKENYEFVDKKVKEYLDKMLQMGNVAQSNGSDAAIAAKENEHGGNADDGDGIEGGGEGGGSEGEPEGLGPDLPVARSRIVQG